MSPSECDDGQPNHKLELGSTLIYQDVIMISEQALCNLPSVKLDHKELALISLLYYGGSMSSPILIYASVANHHARCVEKITYTFKIALFSDQLQEFFERQKLDSNVLSKLCACARAHGFLDLCTCINLLNFGHKNRFN